jgi:hypothetical protein
MLEAEASMADQETHGTDNGSRRPSMEAFMRSLAESARMAAESFAEMMGRVSEGQGQAQKTSQSEGELEAEIMDRLRRMDVEIERLQARADMLLAES